MQLDVEVTSKHATLVHCSLADSLLDNKFISRDFEVFKEAARKQQSDKSLSNDFPNCGDDKPCYARSSNKWSTHCATKANVAPGLQCTSKH